MNINLINNLISQISTAMKYQEISSQQSSGTVAENDQQGSLVPSDEVNSRLALILEQFTNDVAGQTLLSQFQDALQSLDSLLSGIENASDNTAITNETLGNLTELLSQVRENAVAVREGLKELNLITPADAVGVDNELAQLIQELDDFSTTLAGIPVLSAGNKASLSSGDDSSDMDFNTVSANISTSFAAATKELDTITTQLTSSNISTTTSHSIFSNYSNLLQFGSWRIAAAVAAIVVGWCELAALKSQSDAESAKYSQEIYNNVKALSLLVTNMYSDVSKANSKASASDKTMSDVLKVQGTSIQLDLDYIIATGRWPKNKVTLTDPASTSHSYVISADSPENYSWLSALIEIGVLKMVVTEEPFFLVQASGGSSSSDPQLNEQASVTGEVISLVKGDDYDKYLNGTKEKTNDITTRTDEGSKYFDVAMLPLDAQNKVVAGLYSSNLGSASYAGVIDYMSGVTVSDASGGNTQTLRNFAYAMNTGSHSDVAIAWGGNYKSNGQHTNLSIIENPIHPELAVKSPQDSSKYNAIFHDQDKDGRNFFGLGTYDTNGADVYFVNNGIYHYYSAPVKQIKNEDGTFTTISSSSYIVDGTIFEKYPYLLDSMTEVYYNGKSYDPKQYTINSDSARNIFEVMVKATESILGAGNSGLEISNGAKLLSNSATSSWLQTLSTSIDSTATSVNNKTSKYTQDVQTSMSNLSTFSEFFVNALSKLSSSS